MPPRRWNNLSMWVLMVTKKAGTFPPGPTLHVFRRICIGVKFHQNQAWYAVRDLMDAGGLEVDADNFLSELGWREFSYSLLFHCPDLPRQNLQPKFDHFPWEKMRIICAAGRGDRPGIPLLMRRCVSFGRQATCTTGCAWLSARSW